MASSMLSSSCGGGRAEPAALLAQLMFLFAAPLLLSCERLRAVGVWAAAGPRKGAKRVLGVDGMAARMGALVDAVPWRAHVTWDGARKHWRSIGVPPPVPVFRACVCVECVNCVLVTACRGHCTHMNATACKQARNTERGIHGQLNCGKPGGMGWAHELLLFVCRTGLNCI